MLLKKLKHDLDRMYHVDIFIQFRISAISSGDID